MKTNERRSYHSWAKMSVAHVCARAHCSTGDERAKGRGRERREHAAPLAAKSQQLYLRRALFRLTLGQPKIMLALLFKTIQNIPETQEHRVNKVRTNL